VCYGSDARATSAVDAASSASSLATNAWDLLAEALGLRTTGGTGTVPPIFAPLKWASVEKANTLAKAKALPAVKALTQVFAEAGFAPSVNFNVGTGELSLTIPLFATEGHVLTSARPAVMSAMLAALPEQAALERCYAADRALFAQKGEGSAAAGASGDLLANRCLEIFATQTGVGIWQRAVDTRTRTVKLSFAGLDDLLGGARKMLAYSPCYTGLAGFSDSASHTALRAGSPEELQAAMETGRNQVISDMTDFFWEKVAAYPYVATPSLRATLGDELCSYMASGLRDPAGGFAPPGERAFSFFLFGGAGTGKSTMVSAFGQALQATLQRFIGAGRRADIVKVALNGLTPESLGMILRVQGISDMSIERLLEQTVSRGSVAILHLEEIPEDAELQEALVSTVKQMVATVLRRYHQYAGNVILTMTSNYRATAAIARSTTQITVVAPSADEQWQHCVGMLETSLKAATKASEVSVALKYTLPLMKDMRPLCQWWTTLSYHMAQRVEDYKSAHGSEAPPRNIAAILSSANGGGVISVNLEVELAEEANVEGWGSRSACSSCGSCGRPSTRRISLTDASPPRLRRRGAWDEEGVEAAVEEGEEGGGLQAWTDGEDAGEGGESDEQALGWGVLSRGVGRGRGRSGIRSWWDAFMVDNDTEGPFNKTLPSDVSPVNIEPGGGERCGAECVACASVGNIWTYVDCKGNFRDPYIPRPCSEPALGVDGDEHVMSQALPSMHSRNSSVDWAGLSGLVEEEEALGTVGAKPLLTVSSMDGFFFVEGDGRDWGVQGTEAERFRRRKNATVVNMCLAEVLKPGVVVVTGGEAARGEVESELLEQAVCVAGESGTKVVRVELRAEGDKEKVNGHQSQIRGGLFKAIDDFNNPNNAGGSSEGLLVIVCKVNETGQYMLRELLETNGESRTHRYAIRKDRVLFILSVDAQASLQEMTVSRAHALIHS